MHRPLYRWMYTRWSIMHLEGGQQAMHLNGFPKVRHKRKNGGKSYAGSQTNSLTGAG